MILIAELLKVKNMYWMKIKCKIHLYMYLYTNLYTNLYKNLPSGRVWCYSLLEKQSSIKRPPLLRDHFSAFPWVVS